MEPLLIDERVRVPAAALSVSAARASGPGGQNVNKVASKIVLRIELALVVGLNEAARVRLEHLARRRDREGRWLVTSQRTRDQGRNLSDALDKVRAVILVALRPPTPRRPTRPSKAAVTRRIEAKRHTATRKRARRPTDASQD